MLSAQCFKDNYLGANVAKGISVPDYALKFIYKSCKNKFTDEEFSKITEQVVLEVKSYNNILDIAEWYSRRRPRSSAEILFENWQSNPDNKLKRDCFLDYCRERPSDYHVCEILEKNPKIRAMVKTDENEVDALPNPFGAEVQKLVFNAGKSLRKVG